MTARVEAVTAGQYPQAYILSCIDSHVPVELVFDQQLGDIFVGRVAGNIENVDQLGSMEYAAKVAGVKLVLVLGHESCGAVKGACDHVKLGNITALLKNIQPAVESVEGHEAKGRNSKNKEFVAEVVEANVRQTVADVRSQSEVLAEMEKAGDLKIVAPQISYTGLDEKFYLDLGYARSSYGEADALVGDLELDQFTPTLGFGFNESSDWLQFRGYLINVSNPSRAQGGTGSLPEENATVDRR